MKRFLGPVAPYMLTLVLPVALTALIAGGLALVSFLQMRSDHLAAVAETAQDQRKLTVNRNINNDIAAVQLKAADLLEQARTGHIDLAGAQEIHVQMVGQLATLERNLEQAQEAVGEENLRSLLHELGRYRSAILQATELAAIDPSSAMRHAYQATLSQQRIRVVHCHALVCARRALPGSHYLVCPGGGCLQHC